MMELKDYLKQYFGFDKFKGNQEAIIENILAGRDTFVLMPTGGGKSLCYQLPAMIQDGTAIVISPLIALMKNQVDAIRGFSEEDGIAHFLNSSLSKNEIQNVKDDILAHKTKLLYVAPESLAKDDNTVFQSGATISTLSTAASARAWTRLAAHPSSRSQPPPHQRYRATFRKLWEWLTPTCSNRRSTAPTLYMRYVRNAT